ncbi:response regulator transcription factor [Paenarthrobacter sp. NPDC056912]|uniref:response regulator transcription factor n=1 Tax=Paenarthrobacter sp. NPDC056912 TaxID=3345965 RepID=UPI00366BC168
MRVLIVDDEPYFAEAIQQGLRAESIAADIALDGGQALERVSVNDYDVVVLDRDIPTIHGDDVCASIVKSHPHVKVIMVTAATRLKDKVGGFRLGADDYLTKPFEFDELVVRLRALSRRPNSMVPPVLDAGDLRLDPYRQEAYRDGRYVRLTRKQFAVLELLIQANGGIVSAETLLEKAWDENIDPFTSALRVTMSTLRKALGDPDPIETLPGVGYKIAEGYTRP